MFAAMLGGGEIILILAVLVMLPLAVASFAFWIWMHGSCGAKQRVE